VPPTASPRKKTAAAALSLGLGYSASNAGFYEGRLGCLATPVDCIPGYAPTAAPFLDARLASLEPKSGYTRVLRAGPGIDTAAPEGSQQRRLASPTSVTTFAYVAVPATPGETGCRGFCGDSNGIVCATGQGNAPQLTAEGTCDLGNCVVLR
jgi:hypothetical protein